MPTKYPRPIISKLMILIQRHSLQLFSDATFILARYSLSGKTSYHQISQNLEAARYGLNQTCPVAVLPSHRSNFIVIRQIEHLISRLRGFEISGSRLNIKMSSYQYRDHHVKDKTVSRPWESPYLGKTVFILRRDRGGIISYRSVNRGSGVDDFMITSRRSTWMSSVKARFQFCRSTGVWWSTEATT